jgi:phosphatidylglycerophosphate synthase
MSKLGYEYENPMEILILEGARVMCPYFYSMGFTPNGITTLSIIFGLLSVFLIYKGFIMLGLISFVISYIFDCMDGYYARTYDMTSEFGEYYDHISDLVCMISLACVIIYRYWEFIDIPAVLVISIALIGDLIHFGCQSKFYDIRHNIDKNEITKLKKICVFTNEGTLNYLKYLSSTTLVVATCGIVLYLEYKKNKK